MCHHHSSLPSANAGQSHKRLTLACRCPALSGVPVAGAAPPGLLHGRKTSKMQRKLQRDEFSNQGIPYPQVYTRLCLCPNKSMCFYEKFTLCWVIHHKEPWCERGLQQQAHTDLKNVILLEVHFYLHHSLILCIKKFLPCYSPELSIWPAVREDTVNLWHSLSRLKIVIQMLWVNKLGRKKKRMFCHRKKKKRNKEYLPVKQTRGGKFSVGATPESTGVSGIMPAKIFALCVHFLDKASVFVILS